MPFCAWFRELARMLLAHRHFRPSMYPRIAGYLLACLVLQRHIRANDRFYQARIRDVVIEDDPLFVLGHWRTGTTYLHYLLGLDRDRVTYPTNHQCLMSTVFLTVGTESPLARLVARIMGPHRFMDNMEWDLGSPQEDELVYLPEGGFNGFYESMIFPKTARFHPETVDERARDERNGDITLRFFRKLTYLSGKRIVSKSPGHVFRIPRLRTLFPRSKYVFIVRDPYEVVVSMLHMKRVFRHNMALQHFADDLPGTIAVLNAYVAATQRAMDLLPREDWASVRFDELLADPVGGIRALYRHFDWPYADAYHARLGAYLESIKDYQRNTFTLDPELKAAVYEGCRDVFEAWGYEK